MTNVAPFANRLLSVLPARAAAALRPHFEAVPLVRRQVLHEPQQAFGHIWFPLRGVVSLLTPMPGNKHVEAVDVGPEGTVGLFLAFGAEETANLAVVRVPGEAARIAAEPFRDVLDRSPGLRRLFARYALARTAQGARLGPASPVGEARRHAGPSVTSMSNGPSGTTPGRNWTIRRRWQLFRQTGTGVRRLVVAAAGWPLGRLGAVPPRFQDLKARPARSAWRCRPACRQCRLSGSDSIASLSPDFGAVHSKARKA